MTDEDQAIIATMTRSIFTHARGDPAALARNIIADLAEAGYEVRKREEPIPIKRNPGEGEAEQSNQ